jgi:hypothetical protein
VDEKPRYRPTSPEYEYEWMRSLNTVPPWTRLDWIGLDCMMNVVRVLCSPGYAGIRNSFWVAALVRIDLEKIPVVVSRYDRLIEPSPD